MRYLLLTLTLFSTAATAATPDYIVDGIYPGMSSAQAKSAGYSLCEKTIWDDISCKKEKPTKEAFGVPVKSINAIFESPYTVVSKVKIKFDTTKKAPKCGKTKGLWGDVVGPECVFDLSKEISKTYGPPVGDHTFTTWHKCGRYAMSLEQQVSELRITDDQDQIDNRKNECERARKDQQIKASQDKTANDFINKMK